MDTRSVYSSHSPRGDAPRFGCRVSLPSVSENASDGLGLARGGIDGEASTALVLSFSMESLRPEGAEFALRSASLGGLRL